MSLAFLFSRWLSRQKKTFSSTWGFGFSFQIKVVWSRRGQRKKKNSGGGKRLQSPKTGTRTSCFHHKFDRIFGTFGGPSWNWLPFLGSAHLGLQTVRGGEWNRKSNIQARLKVSERKKTKSLPRAKSGFLACSAEKCAAPLVSSWPKVTVAVNFIFF